MTQAARAFVPGHVTGVFTIDRRGDPLETGSRGGGITLHDGVTVTVRPAEEQRVFLNDASIEMDAVERVLDALGITARVRAETDLPLGAGFGVSGAMALGTALAANEANDGGLSLDGQVALAHGAEVQAGTGLGDVVAQSRGGMVLRLEPGSPAHNDLDAVPVRSRVEYHVLGGRSTADVLADDAAAITTAGERAVAQVVDDPTPSAFMRASRQFSREADLLTDAVRAVIEDVTAAGGDAAMAMLGETVFALGTGLTDAGYDAAVTSIDPCGARLLDEP